MSLTCSAVAATLLACASQDEIASASASNDIATTGDPFAGLTATKVADLPSGSSWLDYYDRNLSVVDANHVLLELPHTGQGPTLLLIDLTTGERRELGTLVQRRARIRVSPDRRYVVANDGLQLLVAAVDGTGPAKHVGSTASWDTDLPSAQDRFVDGAIIVAHHGELSAYELSSATTRWSVTLTTPYDPVEFVVSTDGKRVFGFSKGTARIIDVADGHSIDAGAWPGERVASPQFEPSGRFVYGVLGKDPRGRLVRFPVDGSPMEEVDRDVRTSVEYSFVFSPDGKQILYRVVAGPAEWFDWPNDLVVRDLATNQRTVLDRSWLGDRYVYSRAEDTFLSDGKTVWVHSAEFLFDATNLTNRPVDLVPNDLRATTHGPRMTLTPGENGFLISELKEPGWFFRDRHAGWMRKLEFEKGDVSSVEPTANARTSAIVRAEEDDLRGTWLISLTHQQRCVRIPRFGGWVNGSLLYWDAEGELALMTSDGLSKKRLPLPAPVGPRYLAVTAISGRTALVERNFALYRVEVPDYSSPLPPSDGASHPENACDQTPAATAAPSPQTFVGGASAAPE